MIQIEFLKNDPEIVATVSNWIYQAWGRSNPQSSLEKTVAKIQSRAGSQVVPFTLVAFVGDVLVGTASVVENDLAHFPEYKPWLASVFVDPEFRSQGVASELCAAADRFVKARGFNEYYLFTYTTKDYYSQRGWIEIGESENRGQPITLMKKNL